MTGEQESGQDWPWCQSRSSSVAGGRRTGPRSHFSALALILSGQRPTCWVGEEERQCWKRRLCSSHRSLHVEPEMIPFLYWSHWGGKAERGAVSQECHCIHGEPVSSDFMQASCKRKPPFKRGTSACKATRAVGRRGCCQATGRHLQQELGDGGDAREALSRAAAHAVRWVGPCPGRGSGPQAGQLAR